MFDPKLPFTTVVSYWLWVPSVRSQVVRVWTPPSVTWVTALRLWNLMSTVVYGWRGRSGRIPMRISGPWVRNRRPCLKKVAEKVPGPLLRWSRCLPCPLSNPRPPLISPYSHRFIWIHVIWLLPLQTEILYLYGGWGLWFDDSSKVSALCVNCEWGPVMWTDQIKIM